MSATKTAKQIRQETREQKAQADAALPADTVAALTASALESEVSARQSIERAAQVSNPVATDDSPKPATVNPVEKTALESALSRMGFKSALQVKDSPDTITLKADSLGKLMALGATVFNPATGLLGLDTNDVSRLIVRVNTESVFALSAAKVKAPRAKGEGNGYSVTSVYTPDVSSAAPNAIMRAEMQDGAGFISLVSGATLTVATESITTLTGKKPANGKDRAALFADVLYADKTTERIISYWLPGLMNAIAARKSLITGDNVSEDATESTVESTDESSAE